MADLAILKTYKLFIGGAFPRSESGKTFALRGKQNQLLANVPDASRKDVKAAVVAARNAQAAWADKTAYNRAQILYRIAEMLDARKLQFVEEMQLQGNTKLAAQKEVAKAIDRLVYYAGWCDKYTSVYSSVNPVASHTHNFSVPEPMGVVAIALADKSALLALISAMAAAMCGGNTCVIVCSEKFPLSALSFAEVLATSDVPAGVVNILSGSLTELGKHLSEHYDVNAFVTSGSSKEISNQFELACGSNLKRFRKWDVDWMKPNSEGPQFIMDLQEIKTVWHPLENTGAAGSKY